MRRTLLGLALVMAAVGTADAQTVVPAGSITANTTWSGTVVLQGAVFVENGATLSILPNTVVRGQPRQAAIVPGSTVGTPGALIVSTEGRISANGTASQPIIFTTAATDNDNDGCADGLEDGSGLAEPWNAGDTFLDDTPTTAPLAPLNCIGNSNTNLWGGVVLLGTAPNNTIGAVEGLNFGEAIVEGLTVPGFAVDLVKYGGVEPNDSSGSMQYFSIRHAGDEIGASNELNGLTMGSVGAGTTIQFGEVYANFDDGFEWFGGTVNTNNLVSALNGDDMFDYDQGFTGTQQFLFGVAPFFDENDGSAYGSASGDRVGEWDGDDCPANCNLVGPSSLADVDVDPDADPPVEPNENVKDGEPSPWPFSGNYTWNLTAVGSTVAGNPAVDPNSANAGVVMLSGFAGDLRNSIIVNTGTAPGLELVAGGAPEWSPTSNVCIDWDGDLRNDLIKVVSTTFENVAAPAAAGCPADGVLPRIGGTAGDAIVNGNDLVVATPPGNILYRNTVNDVPIAWAGLANDNTGFNPQGNGSRKLDGSLKPVKFDPRPIAGLGTANVLAPSGNLPNKTFVTRGAFSTSTDPLWTTDWTVLNIGGIQAD